MKTNLFVLFAIAVSGGSAIGATTVSVAWYNGYPTGTKFMDYNGNYLTAGTSLGGDGAILQLGYYTGATQADPFAGAWVPLTGPGTGLRSTIGDSGQWPDGEYDLVHQFKDDYPNTPLIGTPLAIRFYDTTSLATANYFNCVSNTSGSWNWILGTPEPTLTLAIQLSSPTQVWQGGADSAFRTTIAIPEPSAALLAACGVLVAFRRRRS